MPVDEGLDANKADGWIADRPVDQVLATAKADLEPNLADGHIEEVDQPLRRGSL